MPNKINPSTIARIFEQADGFHYSSEDLPYLDARGNGYPSRAAAMRAAREARTFAEEGREVLPYTHARCGGRLRKLRE